MRRNLMRRPVKSFHVCIVTSKDEVEALSDEDNTSTNEYHPNTASQTKTISTGDNSSSDCTDNSRNQLLYAWNKPASK